MGIYKNRTDFINKKLSETTDATEKRLLSNGFIPDKFKAEYDSELENWKQDEGTDSDIQKISNANYFAINPDKVAGKIIAGTGFLNPVIVKGSLEDVLISINKTLEKESDFDYSKMFDDKTSEPIVSPTKLEEREEMYKNSSFDKKWAKNYEEAKNKLFKEYNEAKNTYDDWSSRVYKQNKNTVHIGDEIDGVSKTIGSINEKKRNRILQAQKQTMDQSIKDLKALGLTQEEINETLEKEITMKKINSKFKEGNFVKYTQGDQFIETWYGIVKEVIDLDSEFAYRIDAYGKDRDGGWMFDSQKTNQKYEVQLRPSSEKEFLKAKNEYTSTNTKTQALTVELVFTNAGGVTVVSDKNTIDKETQDYKKLAYIYPDGEIKYWVENLSQDSIDKIEGMRDTEQNEKAERMNFNEEANKGPQVELTKPELSVILRNGLLDDPKDYIKKTQTVAETLKKYNPGLSENEIKAWVYHKRKFGNPMKGWERYYLKGGAGKSILIQTTKDTEIKDNKFQDLRVVPANTILGIKTKFKNEYRDVKYVICKTTQGELVWINENDFKEVEHVTNETKESLIELVKDGALLFDGNDYFPIPVYLFGDIYQKLKQLELNHDAIVAEFGEEIYNSQIELVRQYLPKTKSFREPIKSNRPNMLCLSEFANDVALFGITQLHEETGVKLGRTVRGRFELQSEKITLFDAFNQWMDQAVKDTDLKNTTRADIKKYYFAKSVSWPKDALGGEVYTNTQKEEFIGNARLAAEELFSEFLATALSFDDSVVLDAIWNERYNAFTSVTQFVDKIPVAFNGSTMFKDGFLDVKPAQRQGLAYLQLVGAGTLAYDVGFGKTLTGILNLAQLVSQGAIKRPLIVVPKPTYKNWIKELFGYWISEDGQKTDFNEFPGAIYHYGAFSGLSNVKLNDWFNLSGKHYERLIAANGDLNKLIPENTITVVSYRGFEQMGFSRNVSETMFDSIARVIMQKDANEAVKSEKKEAKEKVSFYQKIQGWLGLGNKNALVNVDECGFDHITVDEAHNFKNVFASCGKDKSTGRKLFDISATQSTRAVKMFFITNYIQVKHGKNVVDLTATPFTNSPLEIYSMLSHVGLDTLNQYNLFNIKKFFEMFVLQTIEYAIDSKGEIITKPVIKSFQNLKLLQTILFNHFHYKADPKEAGVVRPCKVALPNKDITTYLEMNEMQRANQQEVKAIAKSVSRTDPGAGLRAMAKSLDNAFSPYLFDKSIPESAEDFVENSPKIKYAMECIRSVKDWHEKRGEECSGIVLYSNRGLDYFDYIKDYLIHDLGFKNNIAYDEEMISEVEILSGGGGEADEDRKELIKDAFNAGVVKVIIGTGTIREGINLQKRGTVLIDLYPEWNPTDIIQLIGRIWRQGNIYGYIRFVMPLVINSMDNFINQKLDEKGKRVASIWAPIGDLNTIENTSDLDPAEIKYQLVDDVNERFKMKYDTVKNDMERQFKILSENKETIEGVITSIADLKEAEKDLFEQLTEKKEDWIKLLEYIKTLPLEKYKAIPEMQKTVKDLERVKNNIEELLVALSKYEGTRMDIPALLNIARMIKQRSYDIFTDYSTIGSEIRRKLSDVLNYYTFRVYDRDYGNVVEHFAAVRKAEKSVLSAYGKSFMDDMSEILSDIEGKIRLMEMEKEAVLSDEYKNKLIHQIEAEIEQQRSIRGDLQEQVDKFASLNHLLSYMNDNTDKEGCPIPTEECCPVNKVHVKYPEKEIVEPINIEPKVTRLIPETSYFIPKHQLSIIKTNPEFDDVRSNLNQIIPKIPVTYETDEIRTQDKIAYLHYFYGNMDWYIFEKDRGDGISDKSQYQAYGMTGTDQFFELGYISIADIIKNGKVELDLYFTPKKWSQIIEGEDEEEVILPSEVTPEMLELERERELELLTLELELEDDSELDKGIEVEKEHTETFEKLKKGKIDVKTAIKETAEEHLKDDPNYYSKMQTHFIEYLDSKNNFQKTKKEFKGENSYENALKWGKKNIPNFNSDMVRMEQSESSKKEMAEHIFKETLESKLFNFDNPVAIREVNGVVYKIAEGLINDKKKTYILYRDKDLIGTFDSVDAAKQHVSDLINESGKIQFIEYKGYEIMFEPTYKDYFVNDEQFKSLDDAKKYIDEGAKPSKKTINAYRKGAF